MDGARRSVAEGSCNFASRERPKIESDQHCDSNKTIAAVWVHLRDFAACGCSDVPKDRSERQRFSTSYCALPRGVHSRSGCVLHLVVGERGLDDALLVGAEELVHDVRDEKVRLRSKAKVDAMTRPRR